MTFDNVFDCVVWLLQRDFLHREKKIIAHSNFCEVFCCCFLPEISSRGCVFYGRSYVFYGRQIDRRIIFLRISKRTSLGDIKNVSFKQASSIDELCLFTRRDFQCLLEATSACEFFGINRAAFFFFPLAVSFTSLLFLLVRDRRVSFKLGLRKRKVVKDVALCDVYAR